MHEKRNNYQGERRGKSLESLVFAGRGWFSCLPLPVVISL
jgi:hypothetical protein